MDVMEAIRNRRSIRKYRTDPVTEEALQAVLEAARWAPSWGNLQCWRLVVVRDSEVKQRLAGALRSSVGRENPATRAVREAPLVLVVCAQKGLSGFYRRGEMTGTPATDKGEYWYMFDTALAMQNFTLAAHALGLGTVHIGMFDTSEVARILNIPEEIGVLEMMPLGRPDEKPSPRARKDTGEFVFYERYPG